MATGRDGHREEDARRLVERRALAVDTRLPPRVPGLTHEQQARSDTRYVQPHFARRVRTSAG